MKKHLLIVFSVGFCIGASLQIQAQGTKQNTTNYQNNTVDNAVVNFSPIVSKKPLAAAVHNNMQRSVLTKKKFSSSWNVNSVLVSESNCLTANQATKLIMFTHRISKDWAPTGVNSGFIQSTFTTNYGTTWDSLLQVQDQTNLCRYPSGAIFNPSGNTTPGNAFGVVSGPVTTGSTTNGWVANFFASTKMDKTNNNVSVKLNGAAGVTNQFFPRVSIQATDTKVIVTGTLESGDPGSTTATAATLQYRGASINYATPSGNSFTWTADSIKPSFKIHPTGSYNEAFSTALTAWSKNGTIGYLVFIGIDAAATDSALSYQPIVYKTINGGTSWVKMPAFNYSTIPSIHATLKPTTTDATKRRAFYSQGSGMDAVVDINNNLHLINVVTSSYYSSLDSLDWSYSVGSSTTGSNYIFDTYTTSTGWNARFVDSLQCVTANANSPIHDNTGAKITVDGRIQVSASTDGSHLFYLWIDSDPTLGVPPPPAAPENIAPDIFAKGYNVSTNLYTPTVNFTNDGTNFYMYASNIALVTGSTYQIPATISASRDGSDDTTLPWDHYFVSGIQFDESQFTVGINEITQNGNLAISQNYPNPFNKTTSIDVTLKETANVTIEVYNTIGQKVILGNTEKLSSGTHTLNIDGSKLTAGVYFYTVKAGDTFVTRKMIVQ